MQFVQIERMKLANRNSATTALAPFSSVAILVTLLLAQTAFAAEGDIYKTISDDGTTMFTDKPSDKSRTMAPMEPNILTRPLSTVKTQTADNEEQNESEPADPRPLVVNSVEITSPKNQQTLINPRGPILIGITTGPEYGMPEGYTAEIKMNGKVVSKGEGTLLAVPVPDRGTHIIEAVVLDSNGAVQASSETVTVHVKKSFIRKEE